MSVRRVCAEDCVGGELAFAPDTLWLQSSHTKLGATNTVHLDTRTLRGVAPSHMEQHSDQRQRAACILTRDASLAGAEADGLVEYLHGFVGQLH